jgi:hypothetical protein
MKGYIYTLEVMLAISIIVGSLFLIMGNVNTQQNYIPTSMSRQVMDALKYMDMKGELRQYVSTDDDVSVETNMTSLLPDTIKFEVDICAINCVSTAVPSDQTVISLDYFISGYKDSYFGKRVHVWIWEKY